jgi:hypothetical protein
LELATIKNGAAQPINIQTGTIPDVSCGMRDWFKPMNFITVNKTVANFQNVETQLATNFRGVIQSLKERDLQLKPEGQRAWSWLQIHADPVLALLVDDIVEFSSRKYRVMAFRDYKIYGYVEYHLVEDWTAQTTSPVTSYTLLAYGLGMATKV